MPTWLYVETAAVWMWMNMANPKKTTSKNIKKESKNFLIYGLSKKIRIPTCFRYGRGRPSIGSCRVSIWS